MSRYLTAFVTVATLVGVVFLATATQSEAQVVLYNNVPIGAETVSTTGGSPRTGGADEMFFDGDSALLTAMRFGYSVAAGGPAAFDMRFRIWDGIDAAATTTAQFNNLASDFRVAFTGQTAGAFITGPISLTSLPGGGVTVTSSTFSGPGLIDAYVQVDFLQTGTNTPVAANGVTYLFDFTGSNTGFTLGSAALGGTQADEFYWRDADGNGTIIGNEARNFVAPNRANLVMEFSGIVAVVVPETNTLALLAFGIVPVAGAVVARRRKTA